MSARTQMTPEQRIRSIQRVLTDTLDKLRVIRNDGIAAKADASKIHDFKGSQSVATTYHKRVLEYSDLLYETHLVADTVIADLDKTNIATSERYYKEICSTIEYFADMDRQQSAMQNQTIAEALRNFNIPSGSDVTAQSSVMPILTPRRAYLPKVTLPTFSGILSEWPTFKDTYISLVHGDETITTMDKYHFLVSALSGSARIAIKRIPFTESEYQNAWQALLDQFDNKKELAHSLVSDILHFSPSKGMSPLNTLQEFLSTVSVRVASLKALQVFDLADYLLYDISSRHLDTSTQETFELENVDTDFPTFTTLEAFIKKRCKALRNVSIPIPKPAAAGTFQRLRPPTPNSSQPKAKGVSFMTASDHATCSLCKGSHILNDCPTFSSLTPHQRLDRLRGWSGCKNCLHPYHCTSKCKSKKRCFHCKGRHHTKLHLGNSQPKAKSAPHEQNASHKNNSELTTCSKQPDATGASCSIAATALASTSTSNTVLLGTALVTIKDWQGHDRQLRFLIDNGSQYSFLTSHSLQRLGLHTTPFDRSIAGVGDFPINHMQGRVTCNISPCGRTSPTISVDLVVTPSITSCLPQTAVPFSVASRYSSYNLADPHFATPGPIHGLLGADVYQNIVIGAPVLLENSCPSLTETVFGFVIMGKFPASFTANSSTSALSLFVSEDQDLIPIVKAFWEVEEVPLSVPLSEDDRQAEQHFVQTHTRLPSGRYVVSLPFRQVPPTFHSRPQALRRFTALESRLSKNITLKSHYQSFMNDYKLLGHMSPTTCEPRFILPHHGVAKHIDSNNIKLRVVFDGSAKTSTGSLNQYLLPGPKLQADIVHVLLSFRQYPIAFTTDIVKMFRQIEVKESDQDYQTVLWRSEPQDDLQLYALTTVTYGLSCSPYLALRVLQQLVDDEGEHYPTASHALTHHRFVDDIITGAFTLDDALTLKADLITLLRTGGFELDKWASNAPSLLPENSTPSKSIDFSDKLDYVGVLGLHWFPASDHLAYSVKLTRCQTFTKRTILSSICRIYDPLGYLAPIILTAKVFMQRLWAADTGWDQPVAPQLEQDWLLYYNQLDALKNIHIPRLIPNLYKGSVYIAGFCDASEQGYCANIYIITELEGKPISHLLLAKSKVAPLKTLTINRLELLGALLLARLFTSIRPVLESFNATTFTFFTDSQTVLGWLHMDPSLLKTYVVHRVIEILEGIEVRHWNYVPSGETPADLGTRGMMPAQLTDQSLWWTGPHWLALPPERWPRSRQQRPQGELPELKSTSSAFTTTGVSSWNFDSWSERISSFNRCIRVVAYIQRFCYNLKKPKFNRVTGPITNDEFTDATLQCIKWLQRQYYPEAFQDRNLPKVLRILQGFVDERGILRVGGRLRQSKLPYESRHQILLPKRAHFNNLLIDHLHRQVKHAGQMVVQSTLQQRYWIPSARRLIRQRIHCCMQCFKAGRFVKPNIPIMGDLPAVRLEGVRAFHSVGVDFAGPFFCKQSTRRNAPSTKAYLCLFICLAVKAVHLEIASKLSTESFLDAFERFISRRGLPATVYSDCGRNFVGASNYLKELADWHNNSETVESIVNATAPRNIKWIFNPPYAPNFGGIWEANIKVAKSLFRFCIGKQSFTEGELNTIFAKIEAVMNSRPLSAVSSDPKDLDPLTPGHFLIGAPLNALPEYELINTNPNHLSRWQRLRHIVQTFWIRWQQEYVSSLQQRHKWNIPSPTPSEGQLAVVVDPNTLPTCWRLGRIIKLHPGKDNIT